jgi:cardiolipin synthase
MANSEKKNLKKVKRGLFKVIFSRAGFMALSILLQFALLLGVYEYLRDYITVAYVMLLVISFVLVVYVLNNRDEPSFKLAWMVPMLVFPALGAFFYIYFHLQPGVFTIRKRLQQNIDDTRDMIPQDMSVMESLRAESPQAAGIASYVNEYGGYPVYKNTRAKYFPFGEDMFKELKRQLRAARSYIFMEYFIIAEGEMWNSLLEILEEKAAEGVDVRFMYDGMCSIVLVPYNYPKKLESMGIKCKMFSPVRPLLSSVQNNRDHRKITVIDGKVGFTGGINLSDEYINLTHPYGVWKDTAIMLEGEAVKNLTAMFLQLWNTDDIHTADYAEYLTSQPRATATGSDCGGYFQPYGDSPLDNEHVGKQIYMDMLNTADSYVSMMMPYLIVDYEMVNTICYAAKRGVKVQLIMPHIPDKKYAFWLAHNHYPELLKAGVEIYEYSKGFVHAKMFISDDIKATVGSVNLDYRSLYLHWENGVYIYNNRVIADIKADFERTLSDCIRIDMDYYNALPAYEKIIASVLKLFAPLM